MDQLSCDLCGASVYESEAERHMDYHQMVAESFVGFIEIIKAIAGPEFQVTIDRLENRQTD